MVQRKQNSPRSCFIHTRFIICRSLVRLLDEELWPPSPSSLALQQSPPHHIIILVLWTALSEGRRAPRLQHESEHAASAVLCVHVVGRQPAAAAAARGKDSPLLRTRIRASASRASAFARSSSSSCPGDRILGRERERERERRVRGKEPWRGRRLFSMLASVHACL